MQYTFYAVIFKVRYNEFILSFPDSCDQPFLK